jgi:oxygen-dependent protoporphyrinogen oxidase
MKSDVDVLRGATGPGPARRPRIAVIGGGISGLAAAHRLLELAHAGDRAVDITLYEASGRLGGVFGTRRIGEYVIETGADSFVTDKPWCLDLCRRLGLESRLISIDARYRRALILHRGRPVPVPEGLNLLAPSSGRGLLATPLLSLRGKLRAALECCIPSGAADAARPGGDESLASFVRRRFGREFLERIAQPVVGGIYTADPEKLSLAATLPRFLDMEREHGSLIRAARRQLRQRTTSDNPSGARYGLFASLADGMSELHDALIARLREQVQIELNQRVRSVRSHHARATASAASSAHPPEQRIPGGSSAPCAFDVELDTARTQSFDAAILALPGYAAADLLSDALPELSRALAEIEYASSAIVVTGHRLADVSHPLDAAGLVVPHVEGRNALAISFLSRKFPTRAPAGHVILRTFIGGAMQPHLWDQTDELLVRLVRAELRDILGVRGDPEFTLVTRYPRGMPQYHVGHLDRVSRIERLAAQHPGLALAGNALRGVGLPDCIHSGEQAAERVWANCAHGN